MQEKVDELREKISLSIGYKAMTQLELLSLNFHVFEQNYRQWKNYVESLKTPESFMQLWDYKSRRESNLVLAELTRLLLNFLGSATSLVAVTRNSVPIWYINTDFAQEYEERKDKVKSTDETKFIEGLRNYAQHDRLPFLSNQYSIDMKEKKIDMQFVLDRDVLLRGDWKKDKGKDFLYKGKKEVYIESIIDNYHDIILRFHQWIFGRIQEINLEEIRITSAMQDELGKLLNEILDL